MTKEILIDILKTNGNLYTVIDSFIELNYDEKYGENMLEIYKQSYPAELHTDKMLVLVELLKASLLYINSMYFLSNINKLYFRESTRMIPLLHINGACMEIVLLLAIIFPSTTIHTLYIENVASFIYSEMLLGNVNPEFVVYLNTFLV